MPLNILANYLSLVEALVDADKALLIDNQNPKAYFRKGFVLS